MCQLRALILHTTTGALAPPVVAASTPLACIRVSFVLVCFADVNMIMVFRVRGLGYTATPGSRCRSTPDASPQRPPLTSIRRVNGVGRYRACQRKEEEEVAAAGLDGIRVSCWADPFEDVEKKLKQISQVVDESDLWSVAFLQGEASTH